jgi:uncharacterized membrane protein HdeD (DUF308 family)
MLGLISKNWWVFLIRGILAILFGLVLLMRPGAAMTFLVRLFGIFAFVEGIFAVIAAFAGKNSSSNWWAVLIQGLAGLVIGIWMFTNPLMSAVVFVRLLGLWAIIVGLFRIVGAVRLRSEVPGEWMHVVGGIITVLLGIVVMAWPAGGVLAFAWLIGIFALLMGAFLIGVAVNLRNAGKSVEAA